MKLTDLRQLDAHGAPRVAVTIGNFDGVHLGHQQLLRSLAEKARAEGLALVVITFVPHPRKILRDGAESFLITSYERRAELILECGVEFVVELNFTRDFSTQSPEEFLRNSVLAYDGCRAVYLGWDFAFGANKSGGVDLAERVCAPRGVRVESAIPYGVDGEQVSSTLVRSALARGDVALAARLLGRCHTLEGLVVKGEGRGKRIGIPTANLQRDPDLLAPGPGVYATETLTRGMSYKSVTNIGVNPTFKEDARVSVETHILDFDEDVYGEVIRVKFLAKLRDERKFPTVNDLVEQVRRDIERRRSDASG